MLPSMLNRLWWGVGLGVPLRALRSCRLRDELLEAMRPAPQAETATSCFESADADAERLGCNL
eukprot:3683560-Rhodomonas_salina.1